MRRRRRRRQQLTRRRRRRPAASRVRWKTQCCAGGSGSPQPRDNSRPLPAFSRSPLRLDATERAASKVERRHAFGLIHERKEPYTV